MTIIMHIINICREIIIRSIAVLFILFLWEKNAHAQCNGYESLCDKSYDEVAYLTTHNAYNAEQDDFMAPNQTYGTIQQLNDGVRALMIDVYDEDGVPTVYHGFTFLGTAPLSVNLLEIKNFLTGNPNEIITIILECYTTADAIEQALTDADLSDFLYAKDGDWASLQEMIDTNQRLVIFTDVDDASPTQNWYHYVWHHAVETHYSVHDTAEMVCDYNRGNAWNDLFIFNHFITHPSFGTGLPLQAEIANSNPFLMNRVLECQEVHDKFPNFITVDFYEKGDALQAVDALNGVITSTLSVDEKTVYCFPNPASNLLKISGLNNIFRYQLHDVSGKLWQSGSSNGIIQLNELPDNIYFLNVQTNSAQYHFKVVKINH